MCFSVMSILVGNSLTRSESLSRTTAPLQVSSTTLMESFPNRTSLRDYTLTTATLTRTISPRDMNSGLDYPTLHSKSPKSPSLRQRGIVFQPYQQLDQIPYLDQNMMKRFQMSARRNIPIT